MMRTTPRFLYFDLGNVIVHFDHDRMCRQMAETSGVAAERIRSLMLDSPLLRMIEIGELDNRGWYEAFCRETGTRPDFRQIVQSASDIFWLNLDLVPVLSQLAAATWRMGILSNTSQAHWEHIASGRFAIIPTLFEQTVLSYQVHALKPQAEIYGIAAEMAGCRPGEIFYVDDRQENVDGARRAGWDAELFTDVPSFVHALRERSIGFNY